MADGALTVMDSQLHAGTAGFDPAPCPQVGAGVGGVVLHEQAAVPGAAGTGLLSSPSVVVIGDA